MLDSFDLADLPWTPDGSADEKRFLGRVIDLALTRHRWDELDYDPPFITGQLEEYREMVAGFVPRATDPASEPATFGDWRVAPDAEFLERCPEHRLFVGIFGCRLCEER